MEGWITSACNWWRYHRDATMVTSAHYVLLGGVENQLLCHETSGEPMNNHACTILTSLIRRCCVIRCASRHLACLTISADHLVMFLIKAFATGVDCDLESICLQCTTSVACQPIINFSKRLDQAESWISIIFIVVQCLGMTSTRNRWCIIVLQGVPKMLQFLITVKQKLSQ
jgi:hypothetical protein